MLYQDMQIQNNSVTEQLVDEVELFMEEARDEAIKEVKEKKKKRKKEKRKKNLKNRKLTQKIKVIQKEVKPYDRLKIKALNKWFKYSFGYKTTFANIENASTNREYLKASLIISPIKYFFFGATFKKDTNSYYNKYYQPDFSYSFGYSDWHQGTWSLIYSNYSNNKINPRNNENRYNFSSGAWELGYKDKLETVYLSGSLKYTEKSKDGFVSFKASKIFDNGFFISGQIKFYLHTNQQQLTLTAKHYIYKKFFAMGSIYLYSYPKKQTFLEPDYAYKFGWKATKKGKLSITYSNYYTPTRWNWKDDEGPKFNAGSLSISINF